MPHVIFYHSSFLLMSSDLPVVSPGTATKTTNGEEMYLRSGTDGETEERERMKDVEAHIGKRKEERDLKKQKERQETRVKSF